MQITYRIFNSFSLIPSQKDDGSENIIQLIPSLFSFANFPRLSLTKASIWYNIPFSFRPVLFVLNEVILEFLVSVLLES